MGVLNPSKNVVMIRIESKVNIEKYIIPYLSIPKRGGTKLKLWEIVNAILYKLKTGVHWYLLPIKSLIYRQSIKWGAIYHYYRKWMKDGSFLRVFNNIVLNYKHLLDMSICNLDGTHTPCKKGGDKVAYQGRKKTKTTNNLFLVDSTGLLIAFSEPISGNHHDTFQLDKHFQNIEHQMHQRGLKLEGLFINADAGFDNSSFIEDCFKKGIILNNPPNRRNKKGLDDNNKVFDDELYQNRFVVERTNAWMDNERNLLVRQDTSKESWNAWITLFAIKIWINKIQHNN